MLNSVNPVYRKLCPTCGRSIESNDLINNNTCSKCLVNNRSCLNINELNNVLRDELREFEKFFEEVTGSKLWSLQKTWIKRILRGESTVITAPTGMGKTTLLTIYTLYMTKYGKKSLILVPTRTLAKQVYDKLLKYSTRCRRELRIIYYDSTINKRKREEIIEKIINNEYDILILTHSFFIKRENVIDRERINIVIVDDVDSFLKNNRNINRLIKLMGFKEEIIEKINEKYRIMWRIKLCRDNGRDDCLKEQINRLIECEEYINREKAKHSSKQIIISSATGRVRSSCSRIISEILSTSITGLTIYGRNIQDVYLLIDRKDTVLITNLIEKLGSGGLILISPHHPYKEEILRLIDEITSILREKNFKIEYSNPRSIEKIINREIDLLIGSSSYYGLSIRGIDAPESIKYVVFIGTPVYALKLNTLLSSPQYIVRTLLYIYEYKGNSDYRVLANSIRNKLLKLSRNELKLITQLLLGKLCETSIESNRIKQLYNELKTIREKLVSEIENILIDRNVLEIDTITIVKTNNKILGVIPDIYTYIQGSGRTSRLRVGGLTRGLSLIVEFRELANIVKSLNKKLSYIIGRDFLKQISEIDLDVEKEIIESTRRTIDKNKLCFKNILLVVESPTKARTIASFFGKPVKRRLGSITVYEIPFVNNNEVVYLNIVATRGHLFDLTTDSSIPNYGVFIENNCVKPVYDTIKKCRICGYQFTHGDVCLRCGSRSIVDSIEIVNVLRKLAYEVDEVYLATDPDIEGEKIAYDTYLVIKPVNNNIWRIELHEITMRELVKALGNRRDINFNLVEAEIYRRIVDRLIGFSLSQDLWRIFGWKTLGAGRVQTPVLGWIIERYNEYRSSKCWRIIYRLIDYPDIYLQVYIPINERELYSKLVNVDKVVLTSRKSFTETIYPNPPYTTDQLINDAVKIGLTTERVMKIAQELFESGLITYHRTDSTYVSNTGIGIAKKYLENRNLLDYFNPNHWGKPGSHEAIRPVYPLDRFDLEKAVLEGLISTSIVLTNNHYRVYDLIYRRFIASQMKPYRVVKKEFTVDLGGLYKYDTVYTVDIVENGFNHVVKPIVYSCLKTVDNIESRVEIVSKQVYSTKPLYSEGDIVLRMKREGLGRPSTYSKIITSILNHKYVIRSKYRGFLIPTKTGFETYSYLTNKYPELVSTDTTRMVEKQIDAIVNGFTDCRTALNHLIELFEKYVLNIEITENRFEEISISS
ncbi:MAG: reverse gyrase [Desulfurococcaceae archaeon]